MSTAGAGTAGTAAAAVSFKNYCVIYYNFRHTFVPYTPYLYLKDHCYKMYTV